MEGNLWCFKCKPYISCTKTFHVPNRLKMSRLSFRVFAVLLLLVVGALAQQCGRQLGGKTCPNNLCCGNHGWCGDTNDYCSPSKGCQSNCRGDVGGGGGGGSKASATDVRATYLWVWCQSPPSYRWWSMQIPLLECKMPPQCMLIIYFQYVWVIFKKKKFFW